MLHGGTTITIVSMKARCEKNDGGKGCAVWKRCLFSRWRVVGMMKCSVLGGGEGVGPGWPYGLSKTLKRGLAR